MSTISTHVLDVALGHPAVGLMIVLERVDAPDSISAVHAGSTDSDGRLRFAGSVEPGDYRLRFDTGAYHTRNMTDVFFPEVVVTFRIVASRPHIHVPLLLSPFGYSTYRGS